MTRLASSFTKGRLTLVRSITADDDGNASDPDAPADASTVELC